MGLLIFLSAVIAATGVLAVGEAEGSKPPRAVVKYVPAQDAILVVGAFGSSFESDMRAVMDRHKTAKLVILSSNGGMRAQASKVARLINDDRMTVRIFGKCASACALLWATAQRREMTAESNLGLHRSRLAGVLPKAIEGRIAQRNDEEDAEILRAAGFPEALIAKRDATPPGSVAWFSAAELKRKGVRFSLLTRPVE